jgi:hypothetical protein
MPINVANGRAMVLAKYQPKPLQYINGGWRRKAGGAAMAAAMALAAVQLFLVQPETLGCL